jgi:hypothetical protein
MVEVGRFCDAESLQDVPSALTYPKLAGNKVRRATIPGALVRAIPRSRASLPVGISPPFNLKFGCVALARTGCSRKVAASSVVSLPSSTLTRRLFDNLVSFNVRYESTIGSFLGHTNACWALTRLFPQKRGEAGPSPLSSTTHSICSNFIACIKLLHHTIQPCLPCVFPDRHTSSLLAFPTHTGFPSVLVAFWLISLS